MIEFQSEATIGAHCRNCGHSFDITLEEMATGYSTCWAADREDVDCPECGVNGAEEFKD